MKINRSDLYYFNYFEDYIKICCCNVTLVFSSSIYFFGSPSDLISWTSENGKLTSGQENFILKSVNAICSTEFEFKD